MLAGCRPLPPYTREGRVTLTVGVAFQLVISPFTAARRWRGVRPRPQPPALFNIAKA
jgi:hypothetical protein